MRYEDTVWIQPTPSSLSETYEHDNEEILKFFLLYDIGCSLPTSFHVKYCAQTEKSYFFLVRGSIVTLGYTKPRNPSIQNSQEFSDLSGQKTIPDTSNSHIPYGLAQVGMIEYTYVKPHTCM